MRVKVQQRMQKSHIMKFVIVAIMILALMGVETILGVTLYARTVSVAYDGLMDDYQRRIGQLAASMDGLLETGRSSDAAHTGTLKGKDLTIDGASYTADDSIGRNLENYAINIYPLSDLCTNATADEAIRSDSRVFVIYRTAGEDGTLTLKFVDLAALCAELPFVGFGGVAVFSGSGRSVFVIETGTDEARVSGAPQEIGEGTPLGELAQYRRSMSEGTDTTTTVKIRGATYALTVEKLSAADNYTVGGYADFSGEQRQLGVLRAQLIASLIAVGVISVALVIVAIYVLNKRAKGDKTYYFTVDIDGKVIERDKAFADDFPEVKEIQERLTRFDEGTLYTIQLPAGDEKRLMTCRVVKRFNGTVDVAATPLQIPFGSEVEVERKDTMGAVLETLADQPRVLLGEIYFNNIRRIQNVFGREFAESVRNTLLDRVYKQFQYVFQFDYYNLGVLQPDGKQLEFQLADMDRIVSDLNRVVKIGSNAVLVSVKCGVTLSDRTMKAYTHDEIMATADAALKRACEPQADAIHRVDYYIFHESQRKLYAKYLFKIDIPQMLQNGDFYLEYQPQYSLSQDKIIGFEALFRVNRRVQINVGIQDIINYAEQSGHMVTLGDFIFRTGMQFAKSIEGMGVSISLNVSLVQLMQTGFVDNFLSIYRSLELQPGSISVEITESYLMQTLDETLEKLNILRSNGIEVHLDDFGTQYSSFTYLKSLPISTIKIDQSFVRDVHKSEYSRLIIKTIVDISRNLKLATICEGVETPQQLALVKSFGCDIIQGYVISRSVGDNTARDMITNYHYDQSALAQFEEPPAGEKGKA